MENYRCAIIGQHPMRFPWGFDEEDTQCRRMKLELAQCIMELRQCGVTEFQVACDPGVVLDEVGDVLACGLAQPFPFFADSLVEGDWDLSTQVFCGCHSRTPPRFL